MQSPDWYRATEDHSRSGAIPNPGFHDRNVKQTLHNGLTWVNVQVFYHRVATDISLIIASLIDSTTPRR